MTVDILMDLRGQLGNARDQGQRPTCLAFAASDAHAFTRSKTEFLSAEYAFYHAVRRRTPLDPNRGIPLNLMIDALREDGQPLESEWPYLHAIPVPISSWKPPKNSGELFKHTFLAAQPSISEVFSTVERGDVVLVGLRITEQFYILPRDNIVRPNAADLDVGRHAVLAVGTGLSDRTRVILLRNSWGPDWGISGHVWVTEDYLATRIICAAYSQGGAR